jgi:hypothetical protein
LPPVTDSYDIKIGQVSQKVKMQIIDY